MKEKIKEINNLVYSEYNKDLLISEIRLKAKRVNQQMLRLERKDEEILKGSFAYNLAQAALAENKTIASASVKGKQINTFRFEENVKQLEKKTVNELNEELLQLNKFERAKTSTLRGIKEVRKTKKEATLNYIEKETGKKLNEEQYKNLISAMEKTEVSKILNKKLGSPRVIKKLAEKSQNKQEFETIIKALNDANNYLLASETAKKPKVKTEEQADLLNSIFGNREIFGVQDYAPNLTEGQDKIKINAVFGGGII